MVLGMGTGKASVELERTEYVRADQSYSLLERIVRATEVDTVVHTFLVVDSTKMCGRDLHEINVIGTMNLLAAAGAPGSSVRQVVVKSSTLVYGARPEGPDVVRRGHAAHPAGPDQPRTLAHRGRELRPRLRRRQPGHPRDGAAVRERARERASRRRSAATCRGGSSPRSPVSTRRSSSSRRTTSSGASSSSSGSASRASTTSPPTAGCPGARSPGSPAPGASLCRRCSPAVLAAPLIRPEPAGASAWSSRTCCGTGGAWTRPA